MSSQGVRMERILQDLSRGKPITAYFVYCWVHNFEIITCNIKNTYYVHAYITLSKICLINNETVLNVYCNSHYAKTADQNFWM